MDEKKGTLVIISSPSGGGKNSVINELMTRYTDSKRLVTTTTRPMRPGETHGDDYYFITKEEFLQKNDNGDFLEYNEYAGNFYGTDKHVLADLQKKHDMVFSQIEVNGRANVQKAGIEHLAIFLMPESLDVLRNRVRNRGGLTEEIIEQRMTIAKQEMDKAPLYDHSVVNIEGKFMETVDAVDKLIQQYRTKNR